MNRDIARIAELAGVSKKVVSEWIGADWPNIEDHAAWIESATDEEIADWIAAGVNSAE